MVFAISNIVTAFLPKTVGTKVTKVDMFWDYLAAAVARHDFSGGRTPGQALVVLPECSHATVSCGVGMATQNPSDYHPILHRGKVGLYLKRSQAGWAKSLSCVVYTRDAYLADPDVDSEEAARLEERWPGHTHVLVAILASVVEDPQLSPWGFVHNLAGGNNDYAPGKLTVAGLIEQARKVEEYDSRWATVAD
jgi:hypothetical protein